MKEDENQVDADLQINPHALDEEWLRQPELFAKYGKMQADAEQCVRELKERLKVLEAKLTRRVIDDPDLAGGKSTQQATDAYIVAHPKYRQLRKKLSDAEHEQELLKSICYALSHKKTALENMVVLLRSEYFAGPTTPKNLPDLRELEEKTKRRARRKVQPRRSKS